MHSYVVRPRLDKSGKVEVVRYYGIPVTSGQVTIDDLAEEISHSSSLTRGDILATVSALNEAIQKHLEDGKTVYIKGIGLFYISATGEGCQTSEECTPSKVRANRICFKADNWMKRVLKRIRFKRA